VPINIVFISEKGIEKVKKYSFLFFFSEKAYILLQKHQKLMDCRVFDSYLGGWPYAKH
jgi:hypothetical protein